MIDDYYHFHDYYLQKYGSHRRRYPKEIHKIIFEDLDYGTCAITVKIVY